MANFGKGYRAPVLSTRFPNPSPIEWCCLAVGLPLVLHYAWILDDAYVYFRYVDNLVYLGHGLVYNRGEFVEGFSSPLWCLILAAFRASGIHFWVAIRVVALASYVVFWYGLVALNRRTASPDTPIINLPLILLGLNYGVLSYFSSGLETPLVLLAGVGYAWFAIAPTSRSLQALLALSPLLRHEFALPLVIAVYWARRSTGRWPWFLVGLSSIFVGSWIAFRVYYYADFFPNTYYLKDIVSVRQGLLYVHDTLWPYGTYFLLPILATLLYLVSRTPACRKALQLRSRFVMLTMSVAVTCYVIKIGGDARHFRYLAFSYTLLACTTAGLGEHAIASWGFSRYRKIAFTAAATMGLAVAALYPRQLDGHPITRRESNRTTDGINDASPHRNNEISVLTPPYWTWGHDFNATTYTSENRGSKEMPYYGLLVSSWCQDLFNAYDRRAVNNLGLTDAFLARTKMAAGRPGHKYGLKPLAEDIATLVQENGNRPRAGMFRGAVDRGNAPLWMAKNIESLSLIERKVFNSHRFWENLRLALTRVRPVDPETNQRRDRLVGVELVRNGSFDKWAVGGWPRNWLVKRLDMVRRIDDDRDGSPALELKGLGERAGISQDLDLDERATGRTLRASAMVKGPKSNELIMVLSYRGAEGAETVKVPYTGGAWERLEIVVEIPADTRVPAANLSFILRYFSKGAYELDNVSAVVEE